MAPKKVLPLGLTEAALDALVAGARTPGERDAVSRALKQALTERVLRAELTAHLGFPEGGERPPVEPNARNGTTPKTALTDDGALPLTIPRDRAGSFTPQLVPKGVRRLAGFDSRPSRSMPAGSPCWSCRLISKSATKSRSPPI